MSSAYLNMAGQNVGSYAYPPRHETYGKIAVIPYTNVIDEAELTTMAGEMILSTPEGTKKIWEFINYHREEKVIQHPGAELRK